MRTGNVLDCPQQPALCVHRGWTEGWPAGQRPPRVTLHRKESGRHLKSLPESHTPTVQGKHRASNSGYLSAAQVPSLYCPFLLGICPGLPPRVELFSSPPQARLSLPHVTAQVTRPGVPVRHLLSQATTSSPHTLSPFTPKAGAA